MLITLSLYNPSSEREGFSQEKKGFKGSERAGTHIGLNPERGTNVMNKAQDCG